MYKKIMKKTAFLLSVILALESPVQIMAEDQMKQPVAVEEEETQVDEVVSALSGEEAAGAVSEDSMGRMAAVS